MMLFSYFFVKFLNYISSPDDLNASEKLTIKMTELVLWSRIFFSFLYYSFPVLFRSRPSLTERSKYSFRSKYE